MSLPLKGLKVLDLSRLLPGPYCTMLMADMGADVIRVEGRGSEDLLRFIPPLVDGEGAAFLALNRGKKSLALNFKLEGARALVRTLAEKADVFLEGSRPGAMARLGLDAPTLLARNPRLVYCSISGYGHASLYQQRGGHDLNYAAVAGILGAGGPPGGPPAMPGTQSADLAGGSLSALVAILAALLERTQTGRGRALDISMTDGALSLMTLPLAGHFATGESLQPGTRQLNGGQVNYATYLTQDGRAMTLAALEPHFWQRFVALVERPDLLAAPDAQGEALEEARAAMCALFASRTRDEWTALVADADVCCEPVLEADELAYHPLHLARGMIRDLTTPSGGLMPAVASPLPFDREAYLAGQEDTLPPLPPAPRLGEHGQTVLREAGFSQEDIRSFMEEGILL